MAQTLHHRGPDDEGVWVELESGIALAHKRLSIIDLSASGHQPMMSSNGRYVLAYNGEIYNNDDLRKELVASGRSESWRGYSDTETLVEALASWGVEKTLARTNGMFAFALWDRRDNVLWLARDRCGEKPLYYGWSGHSFVFGSELKALRAHPDFNNSLCRRALGEYFRLMYVPAPSSIYENIFKLEPGCFLRIEGPPPNTAPEFPLRPGGQHGTLSIKRWWSLLDIAQEGITAPIDDEEEAKQRLEILLRCAVRRQSVADVPLGAFLSGGVDSSLIVALMQDQCTRPVKTFTIGFEEASFNESQHARLVADHLGTDHTEVTVTAADAKAVIPNLPQIFDEPFADSSQIPTYLVCWAARQHVVVALSGDAGDELFGGYNRYIWGPRIWRILSFLPHHLKQIFAAGLMAVPPAGWDSLAAVFSQFGGGSRGFVRMGEKAHKLGSRLNKARTMNDLYLSLISEWQEPSTLVVGMCDPGVPAFFLDDLPRGLVDVTSQMMFRDTVGYLPDDILCKVDRASMANSLETRVPFLDKGVVELAWRIPLSAKVDGQMGKAILRELLHSHVPRELIERPKSGFSIPLGQWLRSDLREWAEALLDEDRMRREGYIDPAPVREAWSQHLSGNFDWTPRLWSVLMFQSWLESVGLSDRLK